MDFLLLILLCPRWKRPVLGLTHLVRGLDAARVAGGTAATLLYPAAQGRVTLQQQKRGGVVFSNTQDSALQRLKLNL